MTNLPKSLILVVDDAETHIDILVETLGDDYDVVAAMDGESALESIESDLPDLILLDIVMPGMDGYQVCEKLKSEDRTRNIPIIFVTVLGEEEGEAKGFALGAVDYISKPFNPELVKARVRNHLELKDHRDHLGKLVEERTDELLKANEKLEHHRKHLEEMVRERTDKLQKIVNLMAGRELRMAELKKVIEKLRTQMEESGMTPVADDPLKEDNKNYT